VYFLDHGRLFAADGPSTSPYAANALLPMSVAIKDTGTFAFVADFGTNKVLSFAIDALTGGSRRAVLWTLGGWGLSR
jgi:hypothetical protein